MTGAGLGAYVHVPFCAARCDYCAFATWTDRAHLVDDYVRAVCREIAGARASGLLGRPATAYVGGGTPSLLGATRLAEILAAVAPAPGAEVTVECNPEDVDAPLLEALHAAGVTRVSLGVQSLVPHVLAGLGRRGVPERSLAALALVGAAGFASFSVDLIYGGPGERAEDLERTLDLLLDADAAPPHLSAYALSVEPGTPLARDPARHPDDDVLAERYERLDEVLAAAGYRWYEVSNWARPGHECRHNENYWAQGDYLGFGPAAHSHLGGRRFHNVVSLDRYLERLAAGRSPVAAEVRRSDAERELERLELALRTRAGVEAAELRDDPAIGHLVERRGDRVVLTRAGRLLASEVSLRLQVPPAPRSVAI